MRVIGLDVHRSFAQVAELENGVVRQCGRVDLVRDKVLAFARTLKADDEVVLEATGNTMAIVKLLKPHVGRVVIANPLQVRVIAEAKAKTDRIDAAALARCTRLDTCRKCGSRTRQLSAAQSRLPAGINRAKHDPG